MEKKTICKDDVLVATSGWECTFPRFFKVIAVQNGYVTIQELCKETTSFEPFDGTLGSGTEMPINVFASIKKIRRKIKQSTLSKRLGEEYIVIHKSCYLSAHIWDGKPQAFDYRNI